MDGSLGGNGPGTKLIASNKEYTEDFLMPKNLVNNLNLKNRTEWRRYCKSSKLPTDIPARPDLIIEYRSVWISWRDWLGNK